MSRSHEGKGLDVAPPSGDEKAGVKESDDMPKAVRPVLRLRLDPLELLSSRARFESAR